MRLTPDERNMQRRKKLLSLLPKGAIGCEIGTWKGEFAHDLYTQLTPTTLYLIDPWKFEGALPTRWYGGALAKNQRDMDTIYENVVNMFHINSNVVIHRGDIDTFLSAYAPLPHFLDWAYIDGNHSYEFVLNDLRSVKTCMTEGGVIAGDDLHSAEVRAAVEEFRRTEGSTIKNYEVVDETQFIIYV